MVSPVFPSTPSSQSGFSAESHNCEIAPYESRLTIVGIAVSLLAAVMLARDLGGILVARLQGGNFGAVVEQVLFCTIIVFLVYGNLVYQIARLGYLRRRAGHRAATREEIEAAYDRDASPPLAVLVPAYREEPHVVRQTLMSAALLEYPNRHIVLLIDDPPEASDPAAQRNLEAMRRLPEEIEDALCRPAAKLAGEARMFRARLGKGGVDLHEETVRLARLYSAVAQWLEARAVQWQARDHIDSFFIERILLEPAREHRRTAAELSESTMADALPLERIERHYRRLAALFNVRLTSFERKRYTNLSHEPNKAMNLNSYIGLMGKRHRELAKDGNLHLVACAGGESGTVDIPDATYLVTLDADSMLLPKYALRLIHELELPANRDVAVIQTPYSSYPGATSPVERVAGATTDIQHIVHQGLTRHNATYWVGANALLRRAALDDIGELVEERGYKVWRFISDRTVIEDTESSIDLVRCGWRLVNYPDRLAYSATPADFGALLIQRRRWANGGLLILPKLMAYLLRRPLSRETFGEGFMRTYYLSSLAGVSLGVLILLLYPFEDSMRSLWLPLTALPYFLLYGRDLVQSGYRWIDLARVYSINLMLIPIHLGGVLLSLRQACTGRRTPFARTPKIAERTAAPPVYHLSIYAIIMYCGVNSMIDLGNGRWAHALFGFVNVIFFGYAVVRFMGIREFMEDLLACWRARRPRLVPPVGNAAVMSDGGTTRQLPRT